MLRAIREIQPRWVVGENVFGLINWNRGMVFDQVQADLEDSGYHVWTYVLPAASVNAPHRRDRVWFVAYANNTGRDSGCGEIQKTDGEISQWDNNAEFSYANNGLASYASSQRHTRGPNSDWKQEDQAEWSNLRYMFAGPGEEWLTSYTDSRRQSGQEYRQKEPGRVAKTIVPDDWSNFPTQSPVCSGNNGFSSRLDGITFPKWRNESIKAAGNAIVPQVVYQIFKAIEQYEKEVA
ncbi:C-5 cytosine-specific DNA methylase [compost metagenome]